MKLSENKIHAIGAWVIAAIIVSGVFALGLTGHEEAAGTVCLALVIIVFVIFG